MLKNNTYNFIFIFFIFFTVTVRSQNYNLVNNCSFEDTVKCPDWHSQIYNAKGWFNATDPPFPLWSMADYYNVCSSKMNVPYATSMGFQYAKTGVAFAGIFALMSPSNKDDREYIETTLNETLEINHYYYVSFYVSFSDKSFYAVNSIGAYITDTMVYKTTDAKYFNVTPQISNLKTRMLTDTAGWTKISGIFKAKGGEKYITIGNFNPDSLTDTVSIPHIIVFKSSYYFIDDVSLYDITAEAGRDTLVCDVLADSAQLGGHSLTLCKYQWSPITGISNPNIAAPKAKPSITTTYIFTQSFADTVFTGSIIDTIYTSVTTDTVIITIEKLQLTINCIKRRAEMMNSTTEYLWSSGDTRTSITATPVIIKNGYKLIVNGGTDYIWNTGETGSSITVNPTTNTTYCVTGTDANGCTAYLCYTVSATDGVEELEIEDYGIKIYPNPANTEITIELKDRRQKTEVSIFNLTGEELFKQQTTNNKQQINISILPSGIYFVKIVNEQGVSVGKFVKN